MPDLFDSRVMVRALRQIPPVRRFVLDRFFTASVHHPTSVIQMDIEKRGRKLAPFQRPTAAGHVVQPRGYESATATAPYMKPKKRTEVADLMSRRPGEEPYSDRTPQQRAEQVLGEDMDELRDQVRRREEWMAVRGITDGKVHIVGTDGDDNDIDYEIDFRRSADHVVTLTTDDRWQDAGDPVADLKRWMTMIARDAGVTGDLALVGEDAADALLNNAKAQKLLDNRRIEAGQLELRESGDQGVIYLGQINGITLVQYLEWYEDPADGQLKPLIPKDRVVLGSTAARCTRHYGVIQDLDAGNPRVDYFPKSWREQDPSAQWVQVQSSPLPVPEQIDAFVSATVI